MSGYAACPACKGAGVIVTGVDHRCGDKPITGDCALCRGIGEVRADVALDYLEKAVS